MKNKDFGNTTEFIFLIIILVILFCLIYGIPRASSAEFKFKDWNKSDIKGWDKQIHFLGGTLLNGQLDKYNSFDKSFLIGQTASLLWEIKDGFYVDGFDIKDHLFFTSGQLLQGLLDHVLFKESIYSNKDLKRIVKKRLNKKLYEQK